MEFTNVVINDEVCPEAHPESTTQVQDKPMEVNDSLPDDYVVKHSDEELMVGVSTFNLTREHDTNPTRVFSG